MANKSFDFSANAIFKKGEDSFRKYTYRDIGTNNIRSYKDEVTDQLKIIDIDTSNYDDGAIKQSLRNLFNFRPGEEILQPEFGSELHRYLYQPIMSMTADKIVRTIKQMLERWEPRIQVLDIPIEADEEEQCYYVQIKYLIPTIQEESSIMMNLNKNKIQMR